VTRRVSVRQQRSDPFAIVERTADRNAGGHGNGHGH